MDKYHKGFALVEILIVVGIISALTGTVVVTSESIRKQSRDDQRKIDLAFIQAGVEELYADCGLYISYDTFDCKAGYETSGCWPVGESPVTGSDWIGDDPKYGKPNCKSTNIYIDKVPHDPSYPERRYRYYPTSFLAYGNLAGMPQSYIICAALENPPTPPMDSSKLAQCGGACGSVECNYYIEGPR